MGCYCIGKVVDTRMIKEGCKIAKSGLTKEQKWTVLILSFGTFLEYFDLMLYVHMSTLLNDLFFPQTNPAAAQLLGATAFCLTYVLRPIGGFIIGRIGDAYGRKVTITLTTFVMATACLIMAFTPIYQDIGITATIMVIVARVLQGFSSLGEKIGAFLYMSETLKNPYRCIAAGIMGLGAGIGGFFALITTSVVFFYGFNWRYAFVFGMFIAVVGVFARLKLRETPEFVDYQRRIAKKIVKNFQDAKAIKNINFGNEKVNKKTILAFFFTELHGPICFYVAIVYLGGFMKKSLGMTPAQIATHNLKAIIFLVTALLIIIYFVKKIHPVKIAIVTALISVVSLPFIPYWLGNIANIGKNGALFSLFCLQCLILILSRSTQGTIDAIQYKYFSIRNRFTSIATTFGIANPLGYALASLCLIPLTHYFGYYALWFVFTPAVVGYVWALYYFRKLEIERGLYFNYPCEEKPPYPDTAQDETAFNYSLGKEYKPFMKHCEFSTKIMNELEELNKEATRKVNLKLVEKAIVFAKRWHAEQVRKTGEPFYHHPLTVAKITSEYYFKTDVLVACILHDTVEDDETKQCTIELIEKEFNKRIAQMVDGVTKNQKIDGVDRILTLEETLIRLHKAKDYEGLFVKDTDRVHNMDTIEGMSPEKQRKVAIETTNTLLGTVANTCEKLGIDDARKYELEERLFKLTNKVLK